MPSDDRTRRPTDPAAEEHDDPHGNTPEAQSETLRGEQGTSSGDEHDDSDPQSG